MIHYHFLTIRNGYKYHRLDFVVKKSQTDFFARERNAEKMATKTYRARLNNLDSKNKEAVDRTHYFFVHCLCQMIERYIAMRKGEYGSKCKRIAEIILSSSHTEAHGIMDQLTRPVTSSSKVDKEWVQLVRDHHRHHQPLFLQHEGFATVDGIVVHTKPQGKHEPEARKLAATAKFWHQVCDMASAFLKSNQELMAKWRKDKNDWLNEKKAWEEEHTEFIAFWNGAYADFEQACEKVRVTAQQTAGQQPTLKKGPSRVRGKRIDRWHLWYQWLCDHPEILAWRQKAAAGDFKPVPPDVQEKIKKRNPRQDKYIPKFLDWLKENNPELKTFDRLRREYVKNYLRFKRPPTLTLPSPKKHPYWFTLELNEFYKDADFENGTIKIRLIDRRDDGLLEMDWFSVQMNCDKRLKPSYRQQMFDREGRYPPYLGGKIGRTLDRPAAQATERKAGVKGVKLVLHNDCRELLFTIVEQDCPTQFKFKKTDDRRCGADNLFTKDDQRAPIRVMTVDLGIRHIGAYAVCEGTRDEDGWRLTYLKKGILSDDHLPALGQIRVHDRQLKKSRSRQGKAPSGERNFIDLQKHRTGMSDDRFKKAAHLIVETAHKHRVDVLLFEKLDTLKPDAFDERYINRQLRDMNRRQIVTYVSNMTQEFGIICKDDVGPWMTSQVCSRCYRPGWRFSIKSKLPFQEKTTRSNCRDFGYPIWDLGGHLFHCPHCGYKVNADINAAGNLAAKFFGLGYWSKNLSRDKTTGVFAWTDGQPRKFDARGMFEKWVVEVKARQALKKAPF